MTEDKVKKLKTLLSMANTHIEQYKAQVSQQEQSLLEKDIRISQLKKDADRLKEEHRRQMDHTKREFDRMISDYEDKIAALEKSTSHTATAAEVNEDDDDDDGRVVGELREKVEDLTMQLEEKNHQLYFLMEKFKRVRVMHSSQVCD